MRNVAGLEPAHVIMSHILAVISKAAEQETNLLGRDGDEMARIFDIPNFPSTIAYQPLNKSDNRVGQTFLNGLSRNSDIAVRLGSGERNDAWLSVDWICISVEGRVLGLSGDCIVLH